MPLTGPYPVPPFPRANATGTNKYKYKTHGKDPPAVLYRPAPWNIIPRRRTRKRVATVVERGKALACVPRASTVVYIIYLR
jgi:hypothetical protein